MTARVRDGEATGFASCSVPTTAGYQRQENLLYRVEVHTAGTGGTARVKWSRDNGATAARCTRLDLSVAATPALTLGGVDRERLLAFEVGDHVELTTDAREVARSPGAFAVVVDRDLEQQRLHVELLAGEPALTGWFEDPAAGVVDGRKVRRWESAPVTVSAAGTGGMSDEIPLGSHGTDDGLVLQFKVDAGGPQRFHVGDYWLIPARASTGAIEWPREGASAALLRPHGPAHRYAPLALLEHVAGGVGAWHVRRDYLFHARCPPLAAQRRLVYCGEALPRPGSPEVFDLTLGVADGGLPVEGATVLVTAGGDACELRGGDSPSAWTNEIRATSAAGGFATWEARLKADQDLATVSARRVGVAGGTVGEAVGYVLRAPRFRLPTQQLLLDLDADSFLTALSGVRYVASWKARYPSPAIEFVLGEEGGVKPQEIPGAFAGRTAVRFLRGGKRLALTSPDALASLDREALTVYVVGSAAPAAADDWLIRREVPDHGVPRWGLQFMGDTKVVTCHGDDLYEFTLGAPHPPRVPAVWSFRTSRSELLRNDSVIPPSSASASDLAPLATTHDGSLSIGGGSVDVARVLIYEGDHNVPATRRAVLAYLAQEYRLLLDRAS